MLAVGFRGILWLLLVRRRKNKTSGNISKEAEMSRRKEKCAKRERK